MNDSHLNKKDVEDHAAAPEDVIRKARQSAKACGWPTNYRIEELADLADVLLAERQRDKQRIEQLLDLFKHEPYHGIRNKLVCPACFGQGEVNGRNSDDPRWMQCLTCNGDGLAAPAQAALAAVRVPAKKTND